VTHDRGAGQQSRPYATRDLLITLLGFTALTALFTYPQILHLTDAIGPDYDALFSIWRLAWVGHQLAAQPSALFDANIFYPELNTLAYSDAMLLLGLVATPALWAGVPPTLIYNLLLLASFIAAGTAMYFCAHSIVSSRTAAWFAGVVFAFQPYRFAHYSHLELLWTCWIPLALWALHRVIETGRVKFGVWLGLFIAAQALTCLYYAVFLVTALAIVAPFLLIIGRRAGIGTIARATAIGSVCCIAITLPYAMPYRAAQQAVGHRSFNEVVSWSPSPSSYLTAQDGNWLYPSPTIDKDISEAVLFPGIALVALAALGFASRARKFAGYAAMTVVAFDLSLGANGLLYPAFYAMVPPYQGLRVPARIFVIAAAGLCLLGAAGMVALRRFGRIGRIAQHAAIVAACVEMAGVPLVLQSAPLATLHTYRWLAEQPRGVVLEWPLPSASDLGDTETPRFMFHSTQHWQPMVNGYSGNYPASFLRLLSELEGFPSAESLRVVKARGVRYLIMHSRGHSQRYANAMIELMASPEVEWQFAERAGDEDIAVFLVRTDE